MFETIGQRESLALALVAGNRLKPYADGDESKAVGHVIETVKAASCGLWDDDSDAALAKDAASQAAAHGSAPEAKDAAAEANGAATAESSNKDRDSGGRFAMGNRAGVGNPFARKVAGFRAAILQATTHEDIKAITKKLIEMARKGNLAAAKLHWAYTCGKAGETPDPDRLDLEEWKLFKEAAPIPKEFESLSRHANTDQQLQMTRILREMSTDRMAKEYQVFHIKELAHCNTKEARKRAAKFAASQAMAHGAAKAGAPAANGKEGPAPATPRAPRRNTPAAASTVTNGAVSKGKKAAPEAPKSAENGVPDAATAARDRAS
jgi:hypothetical protein